MESVIIPPPDIRETVEATCRLVKEGGKEAEVRILSAERSNPKFSFLNQNDPYHPYYLSILQTDRSSPLSTPIAEIVSVEPSIQHMSMDDTLVHRMPYSAISAYDLDVLRLTALFAAANEPSFVSNLVSKELRNPQFDFLKVDHTLNELYRRTTKSYEVSYSDYSNNLPTSPHTIFDMIRQLSIQELSKVDNSESASSTDNTNMESYDWNNFVIGDIIEFHSDEVFSSPITLDSLKNSSSSAKQTIYEIQNTPSLLLVSQKNSGDQFVICPICKGSIKSEEFEKHFKLETISASSSVQKKAEYLKYQGIPLETSSDAVKRNLSAMLGAHQSPTKKRK